MPAYKVCYMNARGRAEIIRLTLAQAGIEFEDLRFSYDEWQSKYKADAPFGLMPWMEVDGKKMGQSMACARYVARLNGMMGADDWETAQIDAVCDGFTDVLDLLVRIHFAKGEEDKKAAMEKVPKLMKSLEEELKKNNGGTGFFVGNNLTLADLRAYTIIENMIAKKGKETADHVPVLAAHYERIREMPNIAAWLAKRPQSEM